MKCSKCKAEIPENAWVCPECGTAVERQSKPEPKPENGPEKKSKKAWIVGGTAAVAITAAAVGVGFFAANARDPKTVVFEALKGVYAEENVNPSEEIFGFKQLYEALETAGGEMGIELAFADSSQPDLTMLQGAGFTIDVASDITNKKFLETLGISYNNMDVASLSVYGDDTYIMASIPELTPKVLTINYADNLSEQIANSPLMKENGITFTEEEKTAIDNYAAYLGRVYSGERQPFDVKALLQRYKEGSQAISALKEAMTVTKADTALFTYNGKEQKCTGYDVVIPKEALIEFLKTTSKFFMEDETVKGDFLEYLTVLLEMSQTPYVTDEGEEFSSPEEILAAFNTGFDEIIAELERVLDGNITMKVYVTKGGALAALDASCALTDNGRRIDITGNAVLEGGSYPTENGNLVFTTSDGTTDIVCSLTKSGEYTDAALNSALTFQMEVDGEGLYAEYENLYDRSTKDSSIQIFLADKAGGSGVNITLNGVADAVEKGKNFQYTLDSLMVEDAAMGGYFELDGSFYLRELQTEITIPEGEQMDVLTASWQDWENLLNEIMISLYSMILGGSFL